MQRDNRAATTQLSILEMISVVLLSAMLVGMMMSEAMAAVTVRPGCSRPNNGCSAGCHTPSSGPCAGDCVRSSDCDLCNCEVVPNEVPRLCWCR